MDDDVLARLPAGLIDLDDVRRVGLDVRVLYRAHRDGRLVRVRPGVFVRAPEWSGLSPERRHALAVQAAGRSLRSGVFSHESAAAMWEMPLVVTPRDVHVTVAWAGGGASTPGVRRHTVRRAVEGVDRGGVAVTDPTDTVLDLAATLPFAHAVVAADHALRTGLVTREGLGERVLSRGRPPGVRRMDAVIGFADARSESPGESLSRAVIHGLGLPAPELQRELADRRGTIGRVDFWWPRQRVVGEFDGRVKYRVDGVADGRALEDRVWAEKRREDRLRAAGLGVARWTWQDALDARRLAAVLERAGIRAADRVRAGREPGGPQSRG